MEIAINGAVCQVTDEISLDQAVSLVVSSTAGVAAAVNGELVRKVAWQSTRLAPGDQIEVLTAVQGG